MLAIIARSTITRDTHTPSRRSRRNADPTPYSHAHVKYEYRQRDRPASRIGWQGRQRLPDRAQQDRTSPCPRGYRHPSIDLGTLILISPPAAATPAGRSPGTRSDVYPAAPGGHGGRTIRTDRATEVGMALSGRNCPDCGRRVSRPLQKTMTGRKVCPDCANALAMGSAAGAITGDVGASFGVWAMFKSKVRRRST
ncbi:hypothetical protein GCM10010124_06300 [Pilimelia terevasa]|uniref:Uncharacterized protein n=1 Tax=Pilimelia terevasa TaxID=53372 RepID=A0A8J3BKY0_9ACTN|nr:hypothetical protein GCM10010124_06300 [Pilimelia terevasa]